MDYEEETEQRLGMLLKNFVMFFALLVILFAVALTGIILFWSPFSKNLSRLQFEYQQDVNYIADFCDAPKAGGNIGYGKNDRCKDARINISKSPWKEAVLETADAWNLCRAGGCSEIFFYLKMAIAVTTFFTFLIALKLSNVVVDRTIGNMWQSHSLPSVLPTPNSAACFYGKPSPYASSSNLWLHSHGKTE